MPAPTPEATGRSGKSFTATPFVYTDPTTLPPIGMKADAPALDEFDPKIMGWMRQAIAAREIIEASSQPIPANDNQQTDTIKIIDPSDWEGQPIPERQWYLEGLIPNRQVTLLSGDGGTGKSLLAYQVGLAGVLGIETLGFRPAEGRVVYFAAEDDEGELKRRGHDILTAMRRTFADLKGGMRVIPMAGKDAELVSEKRRSLNLSLQLWPNGLRTCWRTSCRSF